MSGEVKAKAHVAARNGLGQFIRDCERAGESTVKQMVTDGANLSRSLAPVGHRHDKRTIPLRDSIHIEMFGSTNGRWFSVARHALPIEFGARPHLIEGNPFLVFYWEREGRMWIPGLMGPVDLINHPGNEAQPFLKPAFDTVMKRWPEIAGKFYPD